MRISSRMMVEDAIVHMNDNLERLSALQTQVASGKLIHTPADNPAVAVASLSLRSTLQTNQAYLDTGYVTRDWLSANELALKDLVDIATRAQVLTDQGLPDTQGAAERRALAQELDSLLQQAVGVGNMRHQGKYLFAGFKVATQPYTYMGAGVTNNLVSTADAMQQSIAPGQTLTVNIDGNTALTPLFGALISARDALTAGDIPAAQAAVGALAAALAGLNDVRTTNGARQRQLQTEMDRLERAKIDLKNLLSHKEDVSLTEAISMLKQQETVYQATLEVGRRAITPSLFDYLR